MSTDSQVADSSAPVVAVADTSAPVADVVVSSEVSPIEGGAPILTTAPGCETPTQDPKPERIDYPALVAAGGKFKSKDKNKPEDGGHFDLDLLPSVAPWPEMKDADGNVIPLPWLDHSRVKHFALVKESFASDADYFYFRAWESYNKYLTSMSQLADERNGVSADATKSVKKIERLSKELEGLKALLSASGVDMSVLLAALGKAKEDTTAAALGEKPATQAV